MKYEMWNFLWNFRFGVRGRPMVVHLLDDTGRLAWAAGYDGVKTTWVRARPALAGCGPTRYYHDNGWRKIGRKIGAVDPPPCPLKRTGKVTVLR
jgi:hypothetical protein